MTGPSRTTVVALRLFVSAALAVALSWLGGCAHLRATPASSASTCAGTVLGGRIAVTGEGLQGMYGGFKLVLTASSGRFDVLSPLGQMLAQARWDDGGASLSDGRSVRDFPSFEAMTKAALGVGLPRAALQDWVRGVPAASLPSTPLPDGGFDQLGWRVRPQRVDGALHILRAVRDDGAARVDMVFDPAAADECDSQAARSVGATG